MKEQQQHIKIAILAIICMAICVIVGAQTEKQNDLREREIHTQALNCDEKVKTSVNSMPNSPYHETEFFDKSINKKINSIKEIEPTISNFEIDFGESDKKPWPTWWKDENERTPTIRIDIKKKEKTQSMSCVIDAGGKMQNGIEISTDGWDGPMITIYSVHCTPLKVTIK